MEVREARGDEPGAARAIMDAAMLETGAVDRPEAVTLVAVESGRVLGGLVVVGTEIEAVAVRPGRRGQGVGRALVAAAADRRPRLEAGFDPGVRAFYESLGFEVTCADGRCRGVLEAR